MIYEKFKIDCGDEVVMSITCPDCKERGTRRMDIIERELD